MGWNETVEDAVKREVEEEVGCEVVSMSLIGVYSNPARHPKKVVDVAYKVEISGEPSPGDDAMEVQWASLDDLPSTLAFDHKQIIAEAKSC